MKSISLDTQTRCKRRRAVKKIKIYAATHHMLYVSQITDDIAKAVNVAPQTIEKWAQGSSIWKDAVKFWQGHDDCHVQPVASPEEARQLEKQSRSFNKASRVWKQMIQHGQDLFPPKDFIYPGMHPILENDDWQKPTRQGWRAWISKVFRCFAHIRSLY